MCVNEMKTPYQIALDIFKSFQRDFPKLHMELNKSPVDVDLEMKIPAQKGMKFPIYMNLQNKDELHVVADAFWCEWFPCTKQERASKYAESVKGIISGQNRIEVHKRRGKPIKAILQKPKIDDWVTIATWRTLYFPWGKKSVEYVQNYSST